MSEEVLRHVPYDIEVEQAILGAILVDNTAFFRATDDLSLSATDFFDSVHQRIFATMSAHLAREERVTPLTLHAAMKADPGLLELGGYGYFANLAHAAPAMPNVKSLAQIILNLAKRRRLIRIGEDLVNDSYTPPDQLTVDEIADRASENLFDSAHSNEQGRGAEELIDVIDRAIAQAEEAKTNPHRARILTGLPSVDKALGGLFFRDLTTLAAAPSQGKSGLGAQFGIHASRSGYQTLVFSKEMASEEFAMRYVAQEASVPANRIIEGRISDDELERVALSRGAFVGLPYRLDASPNLTVAQIRARSQATRRKTGKLDLVIVDHLQFVQAAKPRDDEKSQLKQITRDLKAMAKDLNCAVLLIAHLNREFWKRATHRPVISDIYGSSAIEQNSDHIWFLHREEYYLEREQPDPSNGEAHTKWIARCEAAAGWAEVFSAKRRGGPTGTTKIRFDGPLVRFLDPEQAIAEVDATTEAAQRDLAGLWNPTSNWERESG